MPDKGQQHSIVKHDNYKVNLYLAAKRLSGVFSMCCMTVSIALIYCGGHGKK
jgi:hypothetical protein